MTLRRALIRALDRPGGRGILRTAINSLVRRSAPGVRVSFRNGMWIHRQGDVIFVDSPAMDYHPSTFRAWAHEFDRCIADATDHWCYLYRPCPGDLVVDVGAGKGEDTIAFSRAVGPMGRVIAIEAHPVTFQCLRLFCELNCLNNVTAINFAIADRARPVLMETSDAWAANRIAAAGAQGAVSVPGISLDGLIERENLKRIDLLKMNIEGAEALAVQGMERAFLITRSLCISCHDFLADKGQGECFRTKGAVRDAVQQAGFTIVSRDADPRAYVADQVNAIRR
jgi:FkbM family methyltransferase